MLRIQQLLLVVGLATTGSSMISTVCAACAGISGVVHTCETLKGVKDAAEGGIRTVEGAVEGAVLKAIHAGEQLASGAKDAAVWTGRHAASLATNAWKDLVKGAKWFTHDHPWNNRLRQIQISIVNQTNNKILEIRQLGRTGTEEDEPMYFKCGEVAMGAVTSPESTGADTEAHSGDVLMSVVANKQRRFTGVAGGATITVREKGKPTFYMNIAFGHNMTTCNKFSANLTGSAINKQTGKRRCYSVFWSDNTRNTTDWISQPYKMGDEWFVVKAILRPTADDLKMYDGVHYVYAIEQVEEQIGEGDLGDNASQEPEAELGLGRRIANSIHHVF